MTPVLVTGVASGLGRFLHERLRGLGLTRQTSPSEWDSLRQHGADVIIHCAARPPGATDSASQPRYFEDNLALTERLVLIPHRRFVYLSSVDVYPKTPTPHRESDAVMADQASGIYATTKIMSETVVRERAQSPLVLRAAGLLGAYSRRSTLIRMIEDDPCSVGLSGDSSLNFVLHEDVADFIDVALANGLEGIYNVASSENVVLQQVATVLGKDVAFGDHRHDTGNIDNTRIAALWPVFKRTSFETVQHFVRARQENAP